MKKLILILLVAGCATVPEHASRCVDGMHETYRNGRWEPKIDCRGGQLTCHWSEVTEGYRPLRWSSDGCRSVKKLYLE